MVALAAHVNKPKVPGGSPDLTSRNKVGFENVPPVTPKLQNCFLRVPVERTGGVGEPRDESMGVGRAGVARTHQHSSCALSGDKRARKRVRSW